ncbi:MAG: SMC-Scp complex subunit ScpB [Clostridia bacterium]|nr:SMC-Scp complex subunit ScpB [Clostridia bacterium]MBQ7120992.1 SMC-Scp complex subunit ScpB [Clostridia bacterium]
MTNEQIRAACEAILFASGEPVEISRIAQALELDADVVSGALWELSRSLDERGSGICLLRLGSKYQLCSRVEYAQQVRDVLDMKKNAPLSPAAFEVLAVVAYNQPVTKAYIEQIRGVDCSGVVATLCQKGLLEEKGRLDLPGRPLLYGTTPDFLRCFCLSSLADLPELPEKPDIDVERDDEIDNEQGEQIRDFFQNGEQEAID